MDFMYASYAKPACKLIILAKHFWVLIFSIFHVLWPSAIFCCNIQFIQFMCSSIFSKLYYYTIQWLTWDYLSTSQELGPTGHQQIDWKSIQKTYGSSNFYLHDCFFLKHCWCFMSGSAIVVVIVRDIPTCWMMIAPL